MNYILTSRERALLDYLQLDHSTFQRPGELPTGNGKVTLERLTQLGVIEAGAGKYGETGWRLTENGWRCMYGKTLEEMSGSGPYHPLKVWSVPPSSR